MTTSLLSVDDLAEISALLVLAKRPEVRAYLERALPKPAPPMPDYKVGDMLYAGGNINTTPVLVLEINSYDTLLVRQGYPYGTCFNIVNVDRHLWKKVDGRMWDSAIDDAPPLKHSVF
jgi:hypothetical protein